MQFQVIDHVGESSLYRWPLQCESFDSGREEEEKLLQIRVTKQLVTPGSAGTSHAQAQDKGDISSPCSYQTNSHRLVRGFCQDTFC